MSTSGDTVRCPQRASRSAIQAGVVAPGSTLRTTRPEKRPHRSGAAMVTGRRESSVATTAGYAGAFSGAPVMAASSRATPNTLSAWPRLGVSLSVNKVSSRRSVLRMSSPTVAPASSTSRPPWSSESLSSRAEHSMPRLSTPRILPTLMRNGSPPASAGGSSAPTRAHGTRIPASTLGAPQTMLRCSPAPTSTMQTRRRSASGCFSTATTRPTTTP